MPILFSLILALAFAAPVRAQSTSRDEEDVKATLVAMWAAEERGDVAAYASFIHPDFTQFGETAEYLNEGKALEVDGMARYLERAKNVHTVMHQPKVTVRGTVAWVTYYWTDEAIVDGKRVTSRGKSTRILVKENGKWLCIHGHYTLAP